MIDIIEFLYTSDIVHRDIRPQNLMLDYHEEHIKLIDFDFAITYAGYELLTCYVEALVNGQYAAFYHYERTFDLKCALNIIIYMIDKNVQVHDIIGEATSIADNDYVKQATIEIENLNSRKTQKLEDQFQELYDHVCVLDKNLFIFPMFVPMNSTCYDDPTKDHSGPAACQGM
ncbi:unnamed protein product [Rotaria socialis]